MITFKSLGSYGRLGNQLFQIAATIGAGLKTGHAAVFPEWEYAKDINVPTIANALMDKVQWASRQERRFSFDANIFDPIESNSDISLYGYFQSEKYFEHCRSEIYSAIMSKNVFRQSGLKIKYGLDGYKFAALHIRRGDYIHLPEHYIQLTTTSYYKDALAQLNTVKPDKLLVFSDDIPWCQQILTGDNVVFSEGETAFDDLLLMSACQYHIIANSSFSWWGSWLANSKMVIAPKQWFGPAIQHDTKDLYRKEMVLL